MRFKIITAALLALALAATAQDHGVIEGRIVFEGVVPKNPVPDDAGQREDLIRVDSSTKGVQDVLVYLEAPAQKLAAPATEFPEAKMDQVSHRFVPRVLAVRAGQAVVFTNSDPANHNVRTSSSVATNEFNVFTGADGSYRRIFARNPQNQPVKVGCDIHSWMRGWIYVFDHPFFAVTDSKGDFRIQNVPPGEYQAHIVQPDIRHRGQRKIVVTSGEVSRVEAVVPFKE